MSKQQVEAKQEEQGVEEGQEVAGIDDASAAPDPVDIESVLGDPTPEELAGEGTVAPVEGDATPAVEAPGPEGGTEGTGEEDLDDVPMPVQREDGKWTQGKYVTDTLEELVVQVERARRHAEHLVGKKETAKEQTGNPFVDEPDELDDEDFDEEPYTEAEIGSTFGAEIAKALVEAGVVGQQGDVAAQQQHGEYLQALQYADQVIQHPEATGEHFRAALLALAQTNPADEASRQKLLDAWGSFEPVAAAQEAVRIELAKAQVAQEQQQIQQQQAAQQAYEAEQQTAAAENDVQQAFQEARQAFAERNPDWQQHNDSMTAWMAANRPLMARARGDRAAVYSVFQAALDYARMRDGASGVAGEGAGASEHGAVMGTVNEPSPDASANASSAIAQQRDLAGLETGAAVDDVTVSLTNPNPAGLAETPLSDLIGIPTVN